MYLGMSNEHFMTTHKFLFDINNSKRKKFFFSPNINIGIFLNYYLLCHTMETAATLEMTEQNKTVISAFLTTNSL